MHPQFVVKTISELASNDAVFTCDVGEPTIRAARYLKLNGKRRLIGSFSHGSMANAMPQAIGAQATYLKRQVVSLSGGGGFAMLMGDLLTFVQHKLPAKIVVFNNGVLGFVAMEMRAAGFLETGVNLQNPDFAVAETGSVCLTEAELGANTLGYLPKHLIVLLDPTYIVPNIHHAYRRPEFGQANYAVFQTGPSATATSKAC